MPTGSVHVARGARIIMECVRHSQLRFGATLHLQLHLFAFTPWDLHVLFNDARRRVMGASRERFAPVVNGVRFSSASTVQRRVKHCYLTVSNTTSHSGPRSTRPGKLKTRTSDFVPKIPTTDCTCTCTTPPTNRGTLLNRVHEIEAVGARRQRDDGLPVSVYVNRSCHGWQGRPRAGRGRACRGT